MNVSQLLPYIEQQAIYDAIKQTINVPGAASGMTNNWIWDVNTAPGSGLRIGAQPLDAMLCPSDPLAKTQKDSQRARLNYRPCMGDFVIPAGLVDTPRSIFRRGSEAQSTFASIPDGSSNTVLYAEATVRYEQSAPQSLKGGVAWTSLSVTSNPMTCLSTNNGDGTAGSTATPAGNINRLAGIRLYDARMPVVSSLTTMLPPNSPTCGSQAGQQWDNAVTMVPASSFHPGGANVALADASVRFVSETVDAGDPNLTISTSVYGANPYKAYTGESPWGVWGAMGTAGGGESKTIN